MGYRNEAMDRYQGYQRIINGDEQKYKKVFEIIDSRWSDQPHYHACSWAYLEPDTFYDNLEKDLLDSEV